MSFISWKKRYSNQHFFKVWHFALGRIQQIAIFILCIFFVFLHLKFHIANIPLIVQKCCIRGQRKDLRHCFLSYGSSCWGCRFFYAWYWLLLGCGGSNFLTATIIAPWTYFPDSASGCRNKLNRTIGQIAKIHWNSRNWKRMISSIPNFQPTFIRNFSTAAYVWLPAPVCSTLSSVNTFSRFILGFGYEFDEGWFWSKLFYLVKN